MLKIDEGKPEEVKPLETIEQEAEKEVEDEEEEEKNWNEMNNGEKVEFVMEAPFKGIRMLTMPVYIKKK